MSTEYEESEQAVWEQRKEAVWAGLQKELGFYPAPEVKELIDDIAGPARDLEELRDYAQTVRSLLDIAELQAMSQYYPPQKNSSTKTGNRKRYPRPFRKRLYLVDFVINRQLAMKSRKNISRQRINWKQMCIEWNDAHPYDFMTPEVLKATYYRAAADKDVQATLFANQMKVVGESLERKLNEETLADLLNFRKLAQIPITKMPLSVLEKYAQFVHKIGDILDRILEGAQNEGLDTSKGEE